MLNIIIVETGKDRCGLEDNVYTVRDSKVVEAGGYDVAVVGDSVNWDVASVAALPSCIPL